MSKLTATFITASSLVICSGCASFSASKADLLSYQGPPSVSPLARIIHDFTANPCAFGGKDSTTNTSCGQTSWNPKDYLLLVNWDVVEDTGKTGNDQAHSEEVLRRLSGAKGYVAKPYMSRANANEHVAVLVTHVASNQQYIIDDGTVFNPAETGGVGTLDEFIDAVGGTHQQVAAPVPNSRGVEVSSAEKFR